MTADIGRIVVPMNSAVGDLKATIVVKGSHQFNVRLWLAIKLLQLAALIMPVATDIDVKF